MDSFSSSFFAALIGFAIGRGIFELVVWAISKRSVKGTPDQDEGDRGKGKSETL